SGGSEPPWNGWTTARRWRWRRRCRRWPGLWNTWPRGRDPGRTAVLDPAEGWPASFEWRPTRVNEAPEAAGMEYQRRRRRIVIEVVDAEHDDVVIAGREDTFDGAVEPGAGSLDEHRPVGR